MEIILIFLFVIALAFAISWGRTNDPEEIAVKTVAGFGGCLFILVAAVMWIIWLAVVIAEEHPVLIITSFILACFTTYLVVWYLRNSRKRIEKLEKERIERLKKNG